MKVSLNIVKQYIDFELPPVDELVRRINEQLGGVEEIIDLGAKYKDTVIVKIVTSEQHPNADRLRVCKIDDGGKTADVPRDDSGYVQVVCGAPNAGAGKTVVWLPPKSTVPSSFDDKEPFVLEPKELRGVLSQGMLAAPDELAIGTGHDGILEIDPTDASEPGASFAKAYGLDDTIIDIENKMFTHRPDCFGQLGVAREIAGILGQKFEDPEWYWTKPEFESRQGLELETFNDNSQKVPRFMAVALKNIEIKPSPLWLQCALVALGSKPINNVVDITNYMMLLSAQPTHAYDHDKLRGHKLGARMARPGEKVTLLNHKTYQLDETDIVIADGSGPIGLAGIMGGEDSEVSNETKNIVLEVATFDMYTVRKSSMLHGVFTDALTRFNKGQSPLQNDRILKQLMSMIHDMAGGEQASDVADFNSRIDENGGENINPEISITVGFINDRLGLKLSDSEIGTLLRNVHFVCYSVEEGKLQIAAPFWRTDIELPEDIVEEVGRLYGFDKLPRELPMRSVKPVEANPKLVLKSKIRNRLSRAGASEVLNYSFVHGELIDKVRQDKPHAYQLGNALSPDLQYYRLSLVPSLLSKVYMNIRAGYDEFALFELGKAHIVGQTDESGLPREDELTAVVVVANHKTKHADAPYYLAKRYLENLITAKVTYQPVPDAMQSFDITKPYEISRTALVYVDEKFIGIIGEFRTEVRRALKLPDYCAGFELDTNTLLGLIDQTAYRPLSRYPSTVQDISLKVRNSVSYQDLYDCAWNAILDAQTEQTVPTLRPLAIYQPDDDTSTKTITLRLEIVSYERTLTTDMVSQLVQKIADSVGKELDALLV